MLKTLVAIAAVTLTAQADAQIADAAMKRDSAAVRAMIKSGADVNAAQGDGMTALHWAAMNGDAALAKMLIVAGARLEAQTRNANYTPLHLAARAGASATVKLLADAGANVNAATTSGGTTPLHFAAAQGNKESIVALLDKGARIDVRTTSYGDTPLMWAAAYNRSAAIEVLAARGASISAVSRVDNVPQMEAEQRQDQAARNRRVTALRQAEQPQPVMPPAGRGADPNAPRLPVAGRGGLEALLAARDSAGSRADVVDTSAAGRAARDAATAGTGLTLSSLTTRGLGGRGATADSNAGRVGTVPTAGPTGAGGGGERALGYGQLVGNKGGFTPLLFAVREGNADAVNALLKAGADVNQVSQGDHTSPLLMAAINGQFDIAKVLLEKGADPNWVSDAGTAPLYATINVQWAAKALYPQPTAQRQQKVSYLDLMEELLKKGADPNARLTKHLWYASYNFDLLGVNTAGATAFWRAAYGTDVPAMRLLVKYGADPKIPTRRPAGGRQRGDDAPVEEDSIAGDPSGLAAIPPGGPGVYPIHAASGVGYGDGYAANAHVHAPDSWVAAVKYLIEELGADVNARDFNGYSPMHHAAARGDNELINYLVSKGGDVKVVARNGRTTADMANGPQQRITPFPETIALLVKLGAKNNNRCRSC
ncbi:MAG TPA: ankyrin repeat domain-containing protein [Gemmatimonadaceae bacterium]|nr:ankyrin repeat domain-containing protein [Gemmatimonadaceae bacterium]